MKVAVDFVRLAAYHGRGSYQADDRKQVIAAEQQHTRHHQYLTKIPVPCKLKRLFPGKNSSTASLSPTV